MFDYELKKNILQEIVRELELPSVWKQAKKSRVLARKVVLLNRDIKAIDEIVQALNDINDLLQLIEEEGFDQEIFQNIQENFYDLKDKVLQLELKHIFTRKNDNLNCYMDIQSGSGGIDAQDWVSILLRMYLRWVEFKGLTSEIISESEGEIAGLKSVTFNIRGKYAYGWLRTETGIHRLVRKSPFDSGSRRHTSFASVFVYPEYSNCIDIDINVSDLRFDVYRSSGAGGQHVNRTESAVRITHLPTNIVTQCQNSRSQHKNKEQAMKQLKFKLYNLEVQKRKIKQEAVEKSKSDITWGSQIRSYILDSSRVKDLRTGFETHDVQSILDGNLDNIIEASLKAGL